MCVPLLVATMMHAAGSTSAGMENTGASASCAASTLLPAAARSMHSGGTYVSGFDRRGGSWINRWHSKGKSPAPLYHARAQRREHATIYPRKLLTSWLGSGDGGGILGVRDEETVIQPQIPRFPTVGHFPCPPSATQPYRRSYFATQTQHDIIRNAWSSRLPAMRQGNARKIGSDAGSKLTPANTL
jgi:hypothetical protein